MLSIDAPFAVNAAHRLRFTEGVLHPSNPTLADVLAPTAGGPARVQAFIDSGVAAAWPDLTDQLASYAAAHRDRLTLIPATRIVPGGEAVKNERRHLDGLLAAMHEAGLCRQSYALAIGGGAVLDAVGLAAALTHRGVRLVRLPTTTLAQADSCVAVKNGVNAFGKKNFLGAFAVPWAVINDTRFLGTLADRDWRSGFSEAVKVALVKDAAFFRDIETAASRIRARDAAAATPVILRSAEIHLRHITEGGDPFELTTARPLDFGHWAAHRLESLTGYAARHGEAVAIGVAIDTVYSHLAGVLSAGDAERVLSCLEGLGFTLSHATLRPAGPLLAGLEEFREHLGGRLSVTLLAGIGRGFDAHEIDEPMMVEAVAQVAARPVAPLLSQRREIA